jgi:Family of unknown function (DUF5519)
VVAESSGRFQASKNLLMEYRMPECLRKLEAEVSACSSISAHPHRFGGREFRFGDAEAGHAHTGGIFDIPVPRSIHDALLAEGLAEEHRWVPDSGWITFHGRNAEDLGHALWLVRLAYVRYTLKTSSDLHKLLERESEELHLSPRFKSLLEPFVPKTPTIFD